MSVAQWWRLAGMTYEARFEQRAPSDGGTRWVVTDVTEPGSPRGVRTFKRGDDCRFWLKGRGFKPVEQSRVQGAT